MFTGFGFLLVEQVPLLTSLQETLGSSTTSWPPLVLHLWRALHPLFSQMLVMDIGSGGASGGATFTRPWNSSAALLSTDNTEANKVRLAVIGALQLKMGGTKSPWRQGQRSVPHFCAAW